MTSIKALIIAVIIFVIVYGIIFAIGLCIMAGRKAPHPDEYSCNGGLTDEEVKEIQREDE